MSGPAKSCVRADKVSKRPSLAMAKSAAAGTDLLFRLAHALERDGVCAQLPNNALPPLNLEAQPAFAAAFFVNPD